MTGTSGSSFAKRSAVTAIAAGLAAAGCFGSPRDFHPNQQPGQAGYSGGQGGDTTGGGQGGATGTGGTGGATSGVTTQCSATAPTAFTVRWTLEDLAGHPVTCTAVGGATMDLDVLNLATSVASHDTFPCEAGTGTGAALAAGDYTVAMRLYDTNGTDLSQAIAPGMYSIADGCTTDLGLATFAAHVTTPDQYMTLTWTIDRQASGAPLSCADAHAATVELDASGTAYQWPCTDGKGATKSLVAGSFDVAIKLLDASGTVLSVTPGTVPVPVTAGQPKALGNVTFDVK